MGKPTEFGQFDQGAGQAYAPKPKPTATKAAEPFPAEKTARLSEEDDLRSDYYARGNRVQPPSRSNQSTDHMN